MSLAYGVDHPDPVLPDADRLLRAERVRERYPRLDWAELFAAAPAEPEWLVEPIVERGQSVALFGAAKAGKSLLALELAAALAAGRAVLGNPPRPAVRVLYVDAENRPADVRDRLTAMGYGPADLDALAYLSLPPLPPLDTPTGAAELAAVVGTYWPELVVIDTVSRVVAGEENSADTYGALYRLSLAPLKARGIAVLRLDHAGKDETRGQRGSSAKDADVDHVWQLSAAPAGRVVLRRTRTRTGRGAELVELTREHEPVRHLPTSTGDGPPADVRAAIEVLDRLDIPPEHGRDKVRAALAEAGEKIGNDVLAEALRTRRTCPRTGQPAQAPTRSPQTCPGDQLPVAETAGQTCPGQVADSMDSAVPAALADLSGLSPTRSVGQPDGTAAQPSRCTGCGHLLPPNHRAAGLDRCPACDASTEETP